MDEEEEQEEEEEEDEEEDLSLLYSISVRVFLRFFLEWPVDEW